MLGGGCEVTVYNLGQRKHFGNYLMFFCQDVVLSAASSGGADEDERREEREAEISVRTVRWEVLGSHIQHRKTYYSGENCKR